jgi:hypothetical protein
MVSLWQSDIAHFFLKVEVETLCFQSSNAHPLALYAVIVSHSHFQKHIPNYLERDFFSYIG